MRLSYKIYIGDLKQNSKKYKCLSICLDRSFATIRIIKGGVPLNEKLIAIVVQSLVFIEVLTVSW